MRLNNREFETEVKDGMFVISINQESDWSTDHGWSYGGVNNVFELNEQTAKDLLIELKEYLNES